MAKHTILEWDLIHPISEELRNHTFKSLDLAKAGALVRQIMGDRTPTQPVLPGRLPPFVTVRVELDFQARGAIPPKDEEMIVNDPLLHQRIVDETQKPLRAAAKQIAAELKKWDPNWSRPPAPYSQKISKLIMEARSQAGVRIKPLMEQFKRELDTAAKYNFELKVNLAVGTLAVTAAVVSAVLSGGVGAVAAIGMARGGLDLMKSFRDTLIGVETLERRLSGAIVHVRKHASKGGNAVKALLAGSIKLPSVGYTVFGSATWASVADLKNDCDLYENKLTDIRKTVHDLATEIPKLIRQIKDEGDKAKIKQRDIKWRGAAFGDSAQSANLSRTEKEKKLHVLLEKIIEFEKGWRTTKGGKTHEWNWQDKLNGIKAFQATLDEALSSKGIQDFAAWEKRVDLAMNLLLGEYGAASTGVALATKPGEVLNNVVSTVASAMDAVGVGRQAMGESKAKFET